MAPNFTLQSFRGEPCCLSEHLGKKPVLLVFWSYFCFPCQKELPDLQEIAKEMGPDFVTVIGICLDGPSYSDKVIAFAEKNGVKYPLLFDRETQDFFEVAERYGVVGTPTSFLLDANGRVRLIHLGRVDRDLLLAGVRAAKDQSFCAEIIKPPTPSDAVPAGN